MKKTALFTAKADVVSLIVPENGCTLYKNFEYCNLCILFICLSSLQYESFLKYSDVKFVFGILHRNDYKLLLINWNTSQL